MDNRDYIHYMMWKEGNLGSTSLLSMIYARNYARLHVLEEVTHLDDMIKAEMEEMRLDTTIEGEYWNVILRELKKGE